MCTFPIRRFFSAPTIRLLWAGMMLMTLCGCGLFRSDEDGDEDPFGIGGGGANEPSTPQYVVNLEPSSLRVTEANPLHSIALTVLCAGPDLPPDCDLNQPMWISSDSKVVIADRASPATTATLSFSIDPEKRVFTGGRRVAAIVVQPSRVPKGLKLAGNRRLDIEVVSDEPERTEEPETKGRLTFIPAGANPFQANNDQPRFQSFTLVYNGPPTDLVDISFVGGDTQRFSLSRPALPVTLNGRTSVFFLVTFHPGTEPGYFEVSLRATTRDLSSTIKIGGYRS